MTLSFSTKFKNGNPNYFVEKIINSLDVENFEKLTATNIQNGGYQSTKYKSTPNSFPAKIHTIREDKKDRWSIGNKIHFALFNRTKDRFQFAPTLKVKSIQKLEITYSDWYEVEGLFEDGKQIHQRSIETVIDGWVSFDEVLQQTTDFKKIDFVDCPRKKTPSENNLLFQFVVNDGFEDVISFFNWFNKDFKGKIIHWTDFIY